MSRARLIVGTTNYDSDETLGVCLNMELSEPNSVLRTAREFVSPIFVLAVRLTGMDTSVGTKVDAILSDLRDLSGKTISYQEPVGKTVWTVDPVDWDRVDPETRARYSDDNTTAFIEFQFTAENDVASPGGGIPDIPGVLEEPVYSYELTANGLAGMAAQAMFDSLANAQAWYTSLLPGGAGRPAFVPAALRDVGATFEIVHSADGFDPVRVVATFKEVGKNITLPAGVAEASYGVTLVEHDVDDRAGQSPAVEIMLAGQMTLRTEANATFLSDSRVVAPADLASVAGEAVTAIVAHIKAIYGSELHEMDGPTLEVSDVTHGVVTFRQLFVSGQITRWEEQTTIINEEPTEFSRDSQGRDWLYEPAGGPLVTVRHSLLIEAVASPLAYRKPLGINSSNWYRMIKELDTTVAVRRDSEGVLKFTTRGGGVWRYVNSEPTPRTSQSTTVERGLVSDGEIGNGRI